ISSTHRDTSKIETKYSGTLRFSRIYAVDTPAGRVVTRKNGQLIVVGADGVDVETYTVPYGATLNYDEGDEITAGATLAEWNQYSRPILALEAGVIHLKDIEAGVTVDEAIDA